MEEFLDLKPFEFLVCQPSPRFETISDSLSTRLKNKPLNGYIESLHALHSIAAWLISLITHCAFTSGIFSNILEHVTSVLIYRLLPFWQESFKSIKPFFERAKTFRPYKLRAKCTQHSCSAVRSLLGGLNNAALLLLHPNPPKPPTPTYLTGRVRDFNMECTRIHHRA